MFAAAGLHLSEQNNHKLRKANPVIALSQQTAKHAITTQEHLANALAQNLNITCSNNNATCGIVNTFSLKRAMMTSAKKPPKPTNVQERSDYNSVPYRTAPSVENVTASVSAELERTTARSRRTQMNVSKRREQRRLNTPELGILRLQTF